MRVYLMNDAVKREREKEREREREREEGGGVLLLTVTVYFTLIPTANRFHDEDHDDVRKFLRVLAVMLVMVISLDGTPALAARAAVMAD